MCANYRPVERGMLEAKFQVPAPDSDFASDLYPERMGPLIRAPREHDTWGQRTCAVGMFGLVPHWAKDMKIARNTYNARTETVAEKPSFRNAWKRGQFAIIPADSIFEPRYLTVDGGLDFGDEHAKQEHRIERWEIKSADGSPLAIAAIWEYKHDGPNGMPLLSYSMLTINADEHPVMSQFHAPIDEKRMVVMLQSEQYDDWLNCTPKDAPDFFRPYPAESLAVRPAPKGPRTRRT
ncbi:MAG TPA: SOS response-associated peptidase family protein [Paucimonas sp.]|nr:SOS response-associated peptidase family protein [Paucimonas sp.]